MSMPKMFVLLALGLVVLQGLLRLIPQPEEYDPTQDAWILHSSPNLPVIAP